MLNAEKGEAVFDEVGGGGIENADGVLVFDRKALLLKFMLTL